MSKKHYIAIAAIVSARANGGENYTAECVAKDLASYFAKENPAFNEKLFLKACGF